LNEDNLIYFLENFIVFLKNKKYKISVLFDESYESKSEFYIKKKIIPIIEKFLNDDEYFILSSNANFINEKKLINLRKFCKNKNIKFYIINDIKLAFRYKADGLIISSNNKRPIYNFNKQIDSFILSYK
jgi:thiamine monophosphate synthase